MHASTGGQACNLPGLQPWADGSMPNQCMRMLSLQLPCSDARSDCMHARLDAQPEVLGLLSDGAATSAGRLCTRRSKPLRLSKGVSTPWCTHMSSEKLLACACGGHIIVIRMHRAALHQHSDSATGFQE